MRCRLSVQQTRVAQAVRLTATVYGPGMSPVTLHVSTKMQRQALLAATLWILAALLFGCGSEDDSHDGSSRDSEETSQSADLMSPAESTEPQTQAPVGEETDAGQSDLGPVFKTADITVTHPDGYELDLGVVVHEPMTVALVEGPEECSEFESRTSGNEVLKLVPVETTVTDVSGGEFEWPEADPIEWTLISDALDSSDWDACVLGGGPYTGVEMRIGESAVYYFAVVREASPNSPEGDFTDVAPMALRIGSFIVGGAPELAGCPDLAQDACIVGPEVG